MKSIRLYLIVVLLSTICLVNFTAALNGYNRSTDIGNGLLDQNLVETSGAIERLFLRNGPLDANTFGDKAIFQIWQNGVLASRSKNAPETNMAVNPAAFHIVNSASVQWRLYSRQSAERDLTINYGERFDLYRQLVDGIILASLLPVIWALPIIGILVWLIVSYGLRPLSNFADNLRRRSATQLNPIESAQLPSELKPLLTSTNTLLSRLSEAFAREQRFAADAAHELRTPLAALKISLHNFQQENPSDNSDIQSLLDTAKRMENSIEQILALYKLTPETFNKTLSRCSLTQITQEIMIDLYGELERKQQSFDLIGDDVSVQADRFALSMMIKNLLENAVKYSPQGGDIAVVIGHASSNKVTLTVEDSGPGIHESDYQRVFDRFYRVGGDRHTSGIIGSGLGLSIVKHVVRLHNADIMLSKSTRYGGLAVIVSLPLQQKIGH